MTVRQLLSSVDSMELAEWRAEYMIRIEDEEKATTDAGNASRATANLKANRDKYR